MPLLHFQWACTLKTSGYQAPGKVVAREENKQTEHILCAWQYTGFHIPYLISFLQQTNGISAKIFLWQRNKDSEVWWNRIQWNESQAPTSKILQTRVRKKDTQNNATWTIRHTRPWQGPYERICMGIIHELLNTGQNQEDIVACGELYSGATVGESST